MTFPAELDFYFGVVPVLALTLTLALALGVFAVIRRKLPPTSDPFFYQYYRWVVGPVVSLLAALKLTPNQVTLASLVLAIASAFALGSGLMMTGLFLLVAAATCDTMDGVLARRLGIISEQGAFFDSFIDRVSEAVIFAGLAYSGQGGIVTWLSVGALGASLCVSYARARGQSLGVDISVGVMSRPARLVSVIFAIFFSGLGNVLGQPWSIGAGRMALLVLLGLVGVMSTLTAGRRAWAIMQALEARDSQREGLAQEAPDMRAAAAAVAQTLTSP